jgi:hypothetical protein
MINSGQSPIDFQGKFSWAEGIEKPPFDVAPSLHLRERSKWVALAAEVCEKLG